MVPLKILIDGTIISLEKNEFEGGITQLCERHKEENRALAFAFLIYDSENPQIIKILDDTEYWRALDNISGKLLSIYYIHSKEKIFGEDLKAASGIEKRSMYAGTTEGRYETVVPMLKHYLALENNVHLPSILFFQTEGSLITDYFIVELKEEKIEDSFIELKSYIIAAVDRLKIIEKENYGNARGIFENLKQGVAFEKNKKVIFNSVQKFPIQLLLSWFADKI